MKKAPVMPMLVLATVLLASSQAGCQSEGANGNPEEVGNVSWGRDFPTALKASKATGKPVFLLFQEVPGCAGCKQFGRDVLGDPKIVKAIEENFTPLLIHNNKGGKDAEVLKKFGEPAWNFQVVRFLDADGNDLIPRKDRVWEAPELMERMRLALSKAGRPKITASSTRRVAIAQHCFWTGEMKLGAMDGVKRTEVGHLEGNEVTLVDYDPSEIPLDELVRKATAEGVATKVFIDWQQGYRKAPDSDQKRQLQGTKYARLKLTPEQATKVNAFVRTEPRRAEAVLTVK